MSGQKQRPGDSRRYQASALPGTKAESPARQRPSRGGLAQRWQIPLLVLIVLIGFGLRLGGLTWGVPAAPHYRNYYQDERFVLGLLFKMDPARLKLNPEYFINPSLHYYSLLGLLLTANLFGLDLHLPVKDPSPLKPEDVPGRTYRQTFIISRLLVVLEGTVAIVLMFLIGRALYNPKVGLFAALLFAVNYPCMYQAHFFTADGPALSMLVLALFFLAQRYRYPENRLWRVLAPVGIGLAIGTKYLNALMLVPYGYLLWQEEKRSKQPRFLRRFGSGLIIIVLTFLLTTPYALLDLKTFLYGDRNSFGGIFGERGLLFYNNYPPSLTEPFVVTSAAALNGLGLLTMILALTALFGRRKTADVLLLSFIIPFYLLLVYKSSPMLRHILPVLPLVFLACASVFSEANWLRFRIGVAGRILLGVLALTWLGLSLAAVLRMSRPDTRVQAEAWVRQNVTTQVIALPTYFPYRYTPALESFPLMNLEYDLRRLEHAKPEYLLVTEPEYRIDGRHDDKADRKAAFSAGLMRLTEYQLVQRFVEPFRILGLNLNPSFPTEDWNFPSPEIRIYRRL